MWVDETRIVYHLEDLKLRSDKNSNKRIGKPNVDVSRLRISLACSPSIKGFLLGLPFLDEGFTLVFTFSYRGRFEFYARSRVTDFHDWQTC